MDRAPPSNSTFLLLCCFLLFPLFIELTITFTHISSSDATTHSVLTHKYSGSSVSEDDDFGFLSLPKAEWMYKRSEWKGFVDIDESLFLRDQQQPQQQQPQQQQPQQQQPQQQQHQREQHRLFPLNWMQPHLFAAHQQQPSDFSPHPHPRQHQLQQIPKYISGSTLKARIRALSELRDDSELTTMASTYTMDAYDADLLARQNPFPLIERVPKIIHQTWKSYQVQSVFQNYTLSWAKVFNMKQTEEKKRGEEGGTKGQGRGSEGEDEWEYWFWRDEDVSELVETSYSRYKMWYNSFDGYASFIQKADTWKYLALFAFGGVYADLDVEAIKPFDDSLMSVPLLLSTEPSEHSWILNKQEKTVCNAFMSSVPSHPFWLHVLNKISQRTFIGDPVDSTGPRMLQTVLDEYNAQREEALQHNSSRVWRQFPLVVTAPPELYMPFFDQNPVKQKCELEYPESMDVRLLTGNSISIKAAQLCSHLRRRNYVNVAPESSFTIHHWSHTWLGHVKDRVYYDISSQISVGKNKTKKLPSFEKQEIWVEKVFLWDAATTNVSARHKKTQIERLATNW